MTAASTRVRAVDGRSQPDGGISAMRRADLAHMCAACALSGFAASAGMALALLGWLALDNPVYVVGGIMAACAGVLFGWLSFEEFT